MFLSPFEQRRSHSMLGFLVTNHQMLLSWHVSPEGAPSMDVMLGSLLLLSLWVYHNVPLEATVPGPPLANDRQLTTPSLRRTLRKPCRQDTYFLWAVLWFDAFPTQPFLPSLLPGVLNLHCAVSALHLLPFALRRPSQAVSCLSHHAPSWYLFSEDLGRPTHLRSIFPGAFGMD